MRSALQFRNIAKRFGSKAVLKEIGFSVENEDAFGLVSMNGACKATLIKSLLDFTASGTTEIYRGSRRLTSARAAGGSFHVVAARRSCRPVAARAYLLQGDDVEAGIFPPACRQKAWYGLDKPMSGLDPKARTLLKMQLRARGNSMPPRPSWRIWNAFADGCDVGTPVASLRMRQIMEA